MSEDRNQRMKALQEQERLFPGLEKSYKGNDEIRVINCCSPTLPEICLDFRLAMNGASDPWSLEKVKEVKKMLEMRMDTWRWHKGQHHRDRFFDNAVLQMVMCCISMADDYIKEYSDAK